VGKCPQNKNGQKEETAGRSDSMTVIPATKEVEIRRIKV
jgi:hypothetical protein